MSDFEMLSIVLMILGIVAYAKGLRLLFVTKMYLD